ncbi:MAG: hypothetical protein AAGL10_09775 [Pseudomonadota bacterium]
MNLSQDSFAIALKPVGMALFCALMTGCAVNAPVVLQSNTDTPVGFSELQLIAADKDQAHRSALHTAVSRVLEGEGVTISDDAGTVGEIAIADSDSSVGLYASEAGASDDNAQPIAQIREKRWYDGCGTSRTKASIAVFDRASGNLIKRSQVESVTCTGSPLPIDEIADLLVDELTGS